MNKEQILSAYSALKKKNGRRPSYKTFVKESGVSRYQMILNFRGYSELVRAAGDVPGKFIGSLYTDEDYFRVYGAFIRSHKRLPSREDFFFHGIKPTPSAFRHRFKCPWRDLAVLFYNFAYRNEEWKDVTRIMKDGYLITDEQVSVAESSSPGTLKHSFYKTHPHLAESVPPSVKNLAALAYGEGSAIKFESKCGEALRMLGYEVKSLGQGSGRRPDGIAEDPVHKYAVIFDAKQRREKYTPGTDDRAITSYIRDERRRLLERGYDVIYFLVISSGFGAIHSAWNLNVQAETGTPVSFISAENLLRLLAEKIKHPRLVDTGMMKRLFVKGGEITLKEISKILN